jgi:hypothetical protein
MLVALQKPITMNHEFPLQTLSFHWVVYPVSVISQWLNDQDPVIDFFVFSMYFPACDDAERPIQLCAFAFNKSSGCVNANAPDVLPAYENNVLVVNGPLQLSANQVQAQPLRDLIGDGQGRFEYLVFIPNLDLSQRVYYTIYGLKRTATGMVLSDGPIDTNPSPPATA